MKKFYSEQFQKCIEDGTAVKPTPPELYCWCQRYNAVCSAVLCSEKIKETDSNFVGIFDNIAGKPVGELPAPTIIVHRTWRERAFTWPWRPWKGAKRVTRDNGEIYEVNGTYFVTPEAKRMVLNLIKDTRAGGV